MAVTSYMESRALNESLFAHMHFYIVINFEQSIHCLVWQTWANNEWSSNAPQTRIAKHKHTQALRKKKKKKKKKRRRRRRRRRVSFHNRDGATLRNPLLHHLLFIYLFCQGCCSGNGDNVKKFVAINISECVWSPGRPSIQVLTKAQAIPTRVYSLYTLGYDVKTVVQSSDGGQRGALILVPALFHNK